MKTFCVCLCLSLWGCSSYTDEELWLKVESARQTGNWDSTKHVCEMILKEYPKGRYASWAQFGLAESYRFKNAPREALNHYKVFYEKFPDMQPSALSLFMIGYIYNNNLQVYDSAKYFYQQFLSRFPRHDLAPTVKFELSTIGKTPEEVLMEQQKRATNITKK